MKQESIWPIETVVFRRFLLLEYCGDSGTAVGVFMLFAVATVAGSDGCEEERKTADDAAISSL